MFETYPDVVSVKQMREMLGGICRANAYKLLAEHTIKSKKVGRRFLIPKVNIIKFLENR